MSSSVSQPKTIFLKDYRAPDFKIHSVDMTFEIINTGKVHVQTTLKVERLNSSATSLVLDGSEHLLDVSVEIDNNPLNLKSRLLEGHKLEIPCHNDRMSVKINNSLSPAANSTLMGLYQTSGEILCTQCEAEGFRNITYYLDRPDVLSTFTVNIIAAEKNFPVLLANGNLIDQQALPDGRHSTKWHDPHPKPCYLFALVAGKLDKLRDSFTTMSGKKVSLEIFAEPSQINKCSFALSALKEAMRWDELSYGFEYDLEQYMIVAVRDFNYGAMENKSLNIFNSKYILANPDVATDDDFDDVERVVGHEYFHNWTGNRVTCRDWFQLCLKEGLTVFREHQFMASLGSAAAQRIEEVKHLRASQFIEDAGPMAHPVRPDNYIEINNFYTMTVYEKGSEVINMLFNFLGEEGFYQGIRLYIERNDGKAATIEDFLGALADANATNLDQFYTWYQQAGTPSVEALGVYNAEQKTYALTLKQSCAATPENKVKKPFIIPFAVGLLDATGQELSLQVDAARLSEDSKTATLFFSKQEQTFIFKDVKAEPTPSYLRDFSAPIRLQNHLSDAAIYFLMAHDHDAFARWEAYQAMYQKVFSKHLKNPNNTFSLPSQFINALKQTLCSTTLDKRLISLTLSVPTTPEIIQWVQPFDVLTIYHTRIKCREQLARELHAEFKKLFQDNLATIDYQRSPEEITKRSLRNTCLNYLMADSSIADIELCQHYYDHADNMTDKIEAMSAMMQVESLAKDRMYDDFYQRWQHEPLLIDKWVLFKAASAKTLADIKHLQKDKRFGEASPNRVRSMIGGLVNFNQLIFHHESGESYNYLAELAEELDKKNPQLAASVLNPLTRWRLYDTARQDRIKSALSYLQKQKLSSDLFEIVSKSLQT
ncbi:MAG: aminopeptidase N [Oligoflexales bacterium]|nr:aminopeptidase N [Oligoflexales bacterium]